MMEMNKTESIYKMTCDNYVEYGEYISRSRAFPSVMDGLKPVQRRVLIAAKSTALKMCKTAAVTGETMKKWHGHGDSSINLVISSMVRNKLLIGQGNHGVVLMEALPASAPRYTEVKYRSDLDSVLFELVEHSEHWINDLGNNEPLYLNTPIPFCLVQGTTGVGLGANTRIPAFTYKSLLKAHATNNPKYLKNNYGYKILDADFSDLWETGDGRITMTYDVYPQKGLDGNAEVVIEGHGELFRPNLNKLNDLIEQDRIYLRNESKTHVKIVVGRNKGTKAINDKEVFELCKKIAIVSKKYSIKVFQNRQVRLIGIKDWLNLTVSNYENVWKLHKETKISKLEIKIEQYSFMDEVYGYLKKNLSDKKIASLIKKPEEFVKSILEKPIKILRKKDFEIEIAALNKRIAEIKKFKIQEVYRKIEKIL